MLSHELGELAVETGIFPLYEVEDGVVQLLRQDQGHRRGPASASRCASTCSSRAASPTSPRRTSTYFQAKVDEMWDKWEIPGVVPFRKAPAAIPLPT